MFKHQVVNFTMTIDEFLNLSQGELSRLTGIEKGNLSRYFSGQQVTEYTLEKIGEKLEMPSYKVLEAIVLRRKKEL